MLGWNLHNKDGNEEWDGCIEAWRKEAKPKKTTPERDKGKKEKQKRESRVS